MADNNFIEGNSLADNNLFTNPYAQGGAIALRWDKIELCQYLASLSFVVAAGGATTTITPITGNLSPDLEYYRVQISDGSTPQVVNSLDLTNRTTPFVVNTSTLDSSKPWTLFFYGRDNGIIGDVGCSLAYKEELGIIGVIGGSGDTIPSSSKWVNVSYRMFFESTDDAAFTLFPVDGVDIADGGTININDFSTADQLVNGGVYKFKLRIKKLGISPTATQPIPANNDAYTTFSNTVSFPYAISREFVEIINDLTIKTDVAGVKSGTMTMLVANEGTRPTVSLTITTDVAA